MSSPFPAQPASPPLVAVFDTNVLFDWLVFGNPNSHAWAEAIQGGRIKWAATPSMEREMLHVVGRGVVDRYLPDRARIMAAWSSHCQFHTPPAPGSVALLRCRDRDDQKYLDLALACAQLLITRDRDLLKLAKRARAHGLTITPPERLTWD